MEIRKVVRAIILNNEGKVLVGKRARGTDKGKWELIGGGPEVGETMEDAIIREVKEELGVLFSPEHYLEEVDATSIVGEEWKVYFFMGKVKGSFKLKDDEVLDIVYVGSENLEKYDFAYDHKERLMEFFKKFK